MGETGFEAKNSCKARAETPLGEWIGRRGARLNATGDQPADARQSGAWRAGSDRRRVALVQPAHAAEQVFNIGLALAVRPHAGAFRDPFFITLKSTR